MKAVGCFLILWMAPWTMVSLDPPNTGFAKKGSKSKKPRKPRKQGNLA